MLQLDIRERRQGVDRRESRERRADMDRRSGLDRRGVRISVPVDGRVGDRRFGSDRRVLSRRGREDRRNGMQFPVILG